MKKKVMGLAVVGLAATVGVTSVSAALNSTHDRTPSTLSTSKVQTLGTSKTSAVHLTTLDNKGAPQVRTIAQENRLPGTSSWRIYQPANGRIQGYASLDSLSAGGKITFYVSTQRAGTLYNIRVYRMGYYHGKGGRLLLTTPLLKGRAQGWWNVATGDHGLPPQNYPQGFLQLHWKPSYTLATSPSWVSGYYLALLTDARGYQSYIPFVVRDDNRPHQLLVESPMNTWQAYNYWGDYAFYGHYDKWTRRQVGYKGNGAVQVSFDRPYSEDNGAGLTFLEYPTVYWLEEHGYDVAYTTSIGLDENTTTWQPKALISVGHDEYWSQNMRDDMTQMMNDGVNLAFLGANDMYWKVRYADNDRTLIGYRWDHKEDPLLGTSESTGSWRSLGDPESKSLGSMYAGQPYGDRTTYMDPKWIVSDPKSWVFKGLHVYKGEAVPGIIGWEYDSAVNSFTPHKDITILSKSPVRDRVARHDPVAYLTSTIYQASSGAYVFDAGTIWWGYGLSNPVDYEIYEGNAYHKPYYLPSSPIIQGVTRNLLNRFLSSKPNVTAKNG